jgi:biotin carboxyl carrier protein
MHYEFLIDGQTITLELERRGAGEFVARFGADAWAVQASPLDAHTVAVHLGERVFLGAAAEADGRVHVAVGGRHFTLADTARQEANSGGSAEHLAGRILVSPMPGTVVKLLVEVGDTVARGQLCAVVEAMKMENELRAGCDGTVASVRAAEKQQVAGGETLVEIDPTEE